MSQVIRISDDLYKRLESHASGFATPSNVIETILDVYENKAGNTLTNQESKYGSAILPSEKLEIEYCSHSEEEFKEQLLIKKKAYITIFFTDNTSESKEWNASKFKASSSVAGNLRSGLLRGWKKRGIFKAILSVDPDDLA